MAGSVYEFKDQKIVSAKDAIAWQKAIYAAGGMRDEDAQTVADNLITADLRGVYSHGIVRTPIYLKHFKTKNIDPQAKPEIVKEKFATALVDGHNAMGMVAADFATRLAIDLAKKYGTSTVSVTGSNHLGTCAHYAEMAANADMIGFCWSINGANNMAPTGCVEPLIGNNPFAIAVPCKNKETLVMDMATSVVAKGKILIAAKTGMPIPDTWSLDADGKPTTDAKKAMDGTLLPFGGYKGYALSLMIGAFTSILNGSKWGPTMAHLLTNPHDVANNGHLIQVLDISTIADVDEFKGRMDAAVDYIKNGKKAEGVNEILVPGEPEHRTYGKQVVEGIKYPSAVIEENRKLADEFGVKTPF